MIHYLKNFAYCLSYFTRSNAAHEFSKFRDILEKSSILIPYLIDNQEQIIGVTFSRTLFLLTHLHVVQSKLSVYKCTCTGKA